MYYYEPFHNCNLFQIRGELALKMENDIERIAKHTASHEKAIQQNLCSLPDELLMKIIGLLSHSDLSAMMIVNKKFNNLASDPSLWKQYPIPAVEIAQLYGLHIVLEVLKFPKFSKLEVLDLTEILSIDLKKNSKNYNKVDLEQKFLKILETASTLPLKSLNLSFNMNISHNTLKSNPDQDLLSKVALNIQHVGLICTGKPQRASFQTLYKILDGVSVTSVLRSIDIGGCDLYHLPLSKIVKLNCLSEIYIEGAIMTEEQARALMMEMGKGSNIKKFNIGMGIYNLTFEEVLYIVEPKIVAKALNSVEYLIYNTIHFEGEEDWWRNVEPDRLIAVFLEEMADNSTSLKKINMNENNYFNVPANVVAKAFNKLEYLELQPNPTMPSLQVVAILQLMAEQTNVVSLKFTYEDILWLDPGLVARAVVQVEQVDMLCKMSRDHIRAVLGQFDNNSRTRKLDLGTNDVSKIRGKDLANAVQVFNKNGGSIVFTQTSGIQTRVC